MEGVSERGIRSLSPLDETGERKVVDGMNVRREIPLRLLSGPLSAWH